MDPLSRLALFSPLVNLTLVGIKLLLSHLSGSLAIRKRTLMILGVFISGRKSFP